MFTIAKQLSSANTTMTPLIAAAVFYYIFNYLVAFAMGQLEKRYAYYA
jgi:polar amino acid transport system permease protein